MTDEIMSREEVINAPRPRLARKSKGKSVKAKDGSIFNNTTHDVKSAFLEELRKSSDPHRNHAGVSLLHLDRSSIPDWVEAMWARMTLGGRRDNGNLQSLAAQGWKMAPIECHPERYIKDVFGNIKSPGELIEEEDVALAYRAKALCDEDRAYYRQQTEERTEIIPIRDGFTTQKTHRTNMRYQKKRSSEFGTRDI